jgi:hypothetical protein
VNEGTAFKSWSGETKDQYKKQMMELSPHLPWKALSILCNLSEVHPSDFFLIFSYIRFLNHLYIFDKKRTWLVLLARGRDILNTSTLTIKLLPQCLGLR